MKADSAPQFYFTLVSIAITPGNEEFAALIVVHLFISSENVQSCPRLLTSFASSERRRMHEIAGRYTKRYIRTTVHFLKIPANKRLERKQGMFIFCSKINGIESR
jgi:hypothetical protein